jgi:hypothetical protein
MKDGIDENANNHLQPKWGITACHNILIRD